MADLKAGSARDPLYQFPLDPTGTGPYVPRFDVQRTLGQGGMGIVLDAIDRTVDTRVAVKVLPSTDAQGVYLFKREFRSLARIVHPNLVALYELIAHEDAWAFTMELVHGVDYRAWVRPNERLELSRALGATWQIVEGVAALHAAGVLHRDLKPPNVLVTPDGVVKVLDFGLAQDLDADVMPGEGTWGTLPYMSPEQLSGEPLSPASDLYAIGAESGARILPCPARRLQGLAARADAARYGGLPSGTVAGMARTRAKH